MMEDVLLIVLSIIGLLALYWVLVGQWKFNRMIQDGKKEEENNKKNIQQKKE